ncbi:MAG: ferrous iron transport protein A [Clostridiales bacterium]|nr:ferrous iron transport protein A [Clostridiales bacterium]
MSNNLQDQNIDIFTLTTLDTVPAGGSCTIVDCSLPATLKLRLEEMGLTAGCEVTVLKTAPLGDPLEIRVRGYSLCIRKELAKQYTVRQAD